MAEPSQDRLRELHEALMLLAERLEGLEPIQPKGGGAGCMVRYTSARGSHALLDVRVGRVSVTTRSGDLHPEVGSSTTVDELGVDLSDGYLWDDVICESADELAELLVKHMRRRTKEADPEPLAGMAR